MVTFPEVQRRAQAEIDAVVGRARPPTFADAPQLPYVRAIIKEVLRWRPVVELGVPHKAAEDDWYEGMFIPKGATCWANIWHCNHDRAIFGDDADDFRPERYLNAKGDEVLPGPKETNGEGHVTFGFGRRICVGKYLANDSLFINTATILWAAKLECTRDGNGKELLPDPNALMDNGINTLVLLSFNEFCDVAEFLVDILHRTAAWLHPVSRKCHLFLPMRKEVSRVEVGPFTRYLCLLLGIKFKVRMKYLT